MGHPVVGGSWEGFVVENIAGVLPGRASIGFYRTKGGAEMVIDLGGSELWAVEIKHIACEDLNLTRKYAVYGGDESFPLSGGIQVINLHGLMHKIANQR